MSIPLPRGTKVRYHGSMASRLAFHLDLGVYVPVAGIEFEIISSIPEIPHPDILSDDGHRYTVVPHDKAILVGQDKRSNYYSNVRSQSITPVHEADRG